jgi:hypothetical protein
VSGFCGLEWGACNFEGHRATDADGDFEHEPCYDVAEIIEPCNLGAVSGEPAQFRVPQVEPGRGRRPFATAPGPIPSTSSKSAISQRSARSRHAQSTWQSNKSMHKEPWNRAARTESTTFRYRERQEPKDCHWPSFLHPALRCECVLGAFDSR